MWRNVCWFFRCCIFPFDTIPFTHSKFQIPNSRLLEFFGWTMIQINCVNNNCNAKNLIRYQMHTHSHTHTDNWKEFMFCQFRIIGISIQIICWMIYHSIKFTLNWVCSVCTQSPKDRKVYYVGNIWNTHTHTHHV